jgi:hypothetical protein
MTAGTGVGLLGGGETRLVIEAEREAKAAADAKL